MLRAIDAKMMLDTLARKHMLRSLASLTLILCLSGLAEAQLCNIKVVTDANPDYSDMDSMLHSVTSNWPTPAEKCWAMFYWNHIARRQTAPMILHGRELTDPIRQFNDYGYMMCSTIAGTNCAIWDQMGMDVRFWDISLHTVSECFYDDRWHMYDNSMSSIYTLCDGITIAGVEDIGNEGSCAASSGMVEPGHIAKYHCLNATSNKGFLTGADTPRDFAQDPLLQAVRFETSRLLPQLGPGTPVHPELATGRNVHSLLSKPGKRPRVLRAESR